MVDSSDICRKWEPKWQKIEEGSRCTTKLPLKVTNVDHMDQRTLRCESRPGCTSGPFQETLIESKTMSMGPGICILRSSRMILDAQRRLRTTELLASYCPHSLLSRDSERKNYEWSTPILSSEPLAPLGCLCLERGHVPIGPSAGSLELPSVSVHLKHWDRDKDRRTEPTLLALSDPAFPFSEGLPNLGKSNKATHPHLPTLQGKTGTLPTMALQKATRLFMKGGRTDISRDVCVNEEQHYLNLLSFFYMRSWHYKHL